MRPKDILETAYKSKVDEVVEREMNRIKDIELRIKAAKRELERVEEEKRAIDGNIKILAEIQSIFN